MLKLAFCRPLSPSNRVLSDRLLVDATEQAVQRSSDAETQRQHYSGKKKRHTRKTQLIVNEHGQIRHLSRSTPGSLHDLKHFRGSGAGEQIPQQVTVGGDAGYDGLGPILFK